VSDVLIISQPNVLSNSGVSSQSNSSYANGFSKKVTVANGPSPAKNSTDLVSGSNNENGSNGNALPTVQERIEQFQQILKQQKLMSSMANAAAANNANNSNVNNNNNSNASPQLASKQQPTTTTFSMASPQFTVANSNMGNNNRGQLMFNRLAAASSNNSLSEVTGNNSSSSPSTSSSSSSATTTTQENVSGEPVRGVVKMLVPSNGNPSEMSSYGDSSGLKFSNVANNISNILRQQYQQQQQQQQQQVNSAMPNYLYQNNGGMQLSPQNVNKFVRQQQQNGDSPYNNKGKLKSFFVDIYNAAKIVLVFFFT
jgi:hypothetical protein